MTLPTGSQNFFNLVHKAPQDPKLMVIDPAAIEKKNTERRAEMVKVNPPKNTPATVELSKLRNDLFNLQQQAKSTEQKVNDQAGTVRQLENRLNTVLKNKAECEEAGNLIGARTYEHNAQMLEPELKDARERLVREQRYNAGAARALRTWQTENGPRLSELKKQVESPSTT